MTVFSDRNNLMTTQNLHNICFKHWINFTITFRIKLSLICLIVKSLPPRHIWVTSIAGMISLYVYQQFFTFLLVKLSVISVFLAVFFLPLRYKMCSQGFHRVCQLYDLSAKTLSKEKFNKRLVFVINSHNLHEVHLITLYKVLKP